jgi:hypothetical protein
VEEIIICRSSTNFAKSIAVDQHSEIVIVTVSCSITFAIKDSSVYLGLSMHYIAMEKEYMFYYWEFHRCSL